MNNLFFDFISDNFNSIRNDFECRMKRIGLSFDEDIFSETIIKCNSKLDKQDIQDHEMIAYFWTAFKTNTLRDLKYYCNKMTIYELPTNIVDEFVETNNAFDEVSKLIIDKFGEKLYQLFVLHANGTNYKELNQLYSIDNIKYKFRCIREYVRKNYKP